MSGDVFDLRDARISALSGEVSDALEEWLKSRADPEANHWQQLRTDRSLAVRASRMFRAIAEKYEPNAAPKSFWVDDDDDLM